MTSVKDFILLLCRRSREGLTQSMIEEELLKQGFPKDDLVSSINALIQDGDMATFQRISSTTSAAGGTPELVFRPIESEERIKREGLTNDDLMVLQSIKQSKDKGIWTKDIKYKTGLQQTQITKILKTLESRKLIKVVKSVSSKGRKLYMMFDIEPSREITGGAWYTDAELDEELVKLLQQQCFLFISSHGFATSTQVHNYIKQTGVFKVELREEDIMTVLSTLVYDGLVEEVRDPRPGTNKVLWKPSKLAIPKENPLIAVPCCGCPVADDCIRNGYVSPEACEYLTQWLS